MNVIEKREDELPIPEIWRAPLKSIADSYVTRKPPTTLTSVTLTSMDDSCLTTSLDNIEGYPDEIGLLSEKSWERSIYIWMDGYWDILLDLTDISGEVSDLVLDGKMFEDGDDYIFKPHLIYVP